MENQELAILPADDEAQEVMFINGENLQPVLEQIREKAKDLPFDMSIKKNRDEVASFAYKIARSKSAIEKAGAAISAKYKEIPKKIDASRREFKESFEQLQSEVRAPLDAWELAEKQRKEAHELRIEKLKENTSLDENACSSAIQDALTMLDELSIDESFEEYEAEAKQVKKQAVEALTVRLASQLRYEAEQAELEKLRKEAAEREQKEREEAMKREAVEQAMQAEREKNAREVARAELEAEQAKRSLELAEQRRIEQEAQAKLDIERAKQNEIDRQAAEAARNEQDRLNRQADTEHKGLYNRTAMADLVKTCGLTDEQAKAVIVAIIQNKVSNVTINY